jgi:glycosyltransferase involved in cell wall biosynthesis
MISKPKVLIFIDWFYPAHKAGGPIRSVYNMVVALSHEIDFYVVTSAYDIGDVKALDGVALGVWLQKKSYSIIYLEKKAQTRATYQSLIQQIEPDTIYLNSLFSAGFTLKPLLSNRNKIRTVLAPRGMLKKEALAIKPLKKKVFLFLIRLTGLMRSVVWHSSSTIEADEVHLHFGSRAAVVVAQNLTVAMPERTKSTISKVPGVLRLVFVSRINAIKNLYFLLEVLREIKNPMISLDIFGPVEEEVYWESCTKIVAQSKLNVSYKGVLGQMEKEKTLWQYDYLILPTKGENFGHVIAESLCASLPVIISENTPWRNLAAENVGFDLPLDYNSFENILNHLLWEENDTYEARVKACFTYSENNIVNFKVRSDNKKLFLND